MARRYGNYIESKVTIGLLALLVVGIALGAWLCR